MDKICDCSHIFLGAAFALFYDDVFRTKMPLIKYSYIVFFLSHMGAMISFSLAVKYIMKGDSDGYYAGVVLASVFYSFEFASLTCIVTTRASLIAHMTPKKAVIFRTVTIGWCFIFHSVANYYWSDNQRRTGGLVASRSLQIVNATMFVSYILIDISCFIYVQSRLIRSKLDLHNKGDVRSATFSLILNGGMRSGLYAAATSTAFLCSGNFISQADYWPFICYNPIILFLALVTDSHRIKEFLSGAEGTRAGESSDRSSTIRKEVSSGIAPVAVVGSRKYSTAV